MKCEPALREDSFEEKSKKSSPRGVRGDEIRFPQVEIPILRLVPPKSNTQPISGIDAEEDEIIRAIQAQVQSLNWTMQEISQFIASRFEGKRRYQLSHEELVLLLYYLRTLSLNEPDS